MVTPLEWVRGDVRRSHLGSENVEACKRGSAGLELEIQGTVPNRAAIRLPGEWWAKWAGWIFT